MKSMKEMKSTTEITFERCVNVDHGLLQTPGLIDVFIQCGNVFPLGDILYVLFCTHFNACGHIFQFRKSHSGCGYLHSLEKSI